MDVLKPPVFSTVPLGENPRERKNYTETAAGVVIPSWQSGDDDPPEKIVIHVDPQEAESGSGGKVISLRRNARRAAGKKATAASGGEDKTSEGNGQGDETGNSLVPRTSPPQEQLSREAVAAYSAPAAPDVFDKMARDLDSLLSRLAVAEKPKSEIPSWPADTSLDFLKPVPVRPAVRAIFDLGRGGIHLVSFHHAALRGSCLSLVYDNRYDGDRFMPPETPEGETILVEIPSLKTGKMSAVVRDFHQTIGCLDVINVIVLPPPSVGESVESRPDDDSWRKYLSPGEAG